MKHASASRIIGNRGGPVNQAGLETNLVAAYEVSRLAARHMGRRGSGRLIFITSMVGPQSFRGDPAYTASKGGLTALMRALAVELGPQGITANAIAPGFFLTDVNATFFGGPQATELARRIPLRRWGRPDELVGAAIFLASDAASYVNGHVLTVDAGLSVVPPHVSEIVQKCHGKDEKSGSRRLTGRKR